jgi:hypothetical protein
MEHTRQDVPAGAGDPERNLEISQAGNRKLSVQRLL